MPFLFTSQKSLSDLEEEEEEVKQENRVLQEKVTKKRLEEQAIR